jgi:hypothetical protein
VRQVVPLSADMTLDSHLVAFVKLNHVIAGIYMCVHLRGKEHRLLILGYNNVSWETVITTGFELDMLRRKRPYKWTIWVSSLQYSKLYYRLNENSYTLGPVTQACLALSAYSLI